MEPIGPDDLISPCVLFSEDRFHIRHQWLAVVTNCGGVPRLAALMSMDEASLHTLLVRGELPSDPVNRWKLIILSDSDLI